MRCWLDGFAAVGFSMGCEGWGSEWVKSPPGRLLVVGNAIQGEKAKKKRGGGAEKRIKKKMKKEEEGKN